MEHFRGIAVKILSNLVLLYIILRLMYDMSFSNVLLISLVLGLASYLIGDLFLLPRTNNTIATLADFGLAFMVIWILGESITYGDSLIVASLISAAGIALFEYFFHKSIARNEFEEEERHQYNSNFLFQTEAADELYPVRPDVRSEEGNKENE